MKNKNITTLDEHLDASYGKKGTKKRDLFDEKTEKFKIGVKIQLAREDLGWTQKQLADKCKTTVAVIAQVEDDASEVSLPVLKRIVEIGLGGKVELLVKI